MIYSKSAMAAVAGVLAVAALGSTSQDELTKRLQPRKTEQAVVSKLEEIQNAAQALDADKVFSFVLENDQGALVQNGRLFLTRQEALESTKQGFQSLKKVDYKFTQQRVTLLSSTIALAIGEGTASATTADGKELTRPFAQSVVFVLTNGEWKVFHAHRSSLPAR